MKTQTRIEFQSHLLWQQFQQYLKDNAKKQHSGMSANYSIVENNRNIYYSTLDPFTILQKLCKDFHQIAKDSIQWGDMCLVNEGTGKGNVDTSRPGALTHVKSRCWYNINVSSRTSSFSRAF